MKGHLGTAYTHTKGGLEHLDNAVRTVRSVHSAVAPLINHTREGARLNNAMKNLGKSYDAIREKVVAGDRIGKAVVSVACAVRKTKRLGHRALRLKPFLQFKCTIVCSNIDSPNY